VIPDSNLVVFPTNREPADSLVAGLGGCNYPTWRIFTGQACFRPWTTAGVLVRLRQNRPGLLTLRFPCSGGGRFARRGTESVRRVHGGGSRGAGVTAGRRGDERGGSGASGLGSRFVRPAMENGLGIRRGPGSGNSIARFSPDEASAAAVSFWCRRALDPHVAQGCSISLSSRFPKARAEGIALGLKP